MTSPVPPPPVGGATDPSPTGGAKKQSPAGDDSGSTRRRLLPDLTPWRTSRDFRLLWTSGLITMIGSTFTLVAMPLQVKQLTGSAVAVGALGAVELIPVLVFGLYGGALADRLDRRRLALVTELCLAGVAALLLVNSLLGRPALWPLYAAGALTACLQGLQQPAVQALLPRLVPHEQLTAAMSFISIQWSVGGVLGPALGGLVAAVLGPTTAFTVDLVSFVVSALLLVRLRPVPVGPDNESVPTWQHIAEGFRYAVGRPELIGTYVADMAAMCFAVPTTIFPFLADQLGAPWSLGLLYAATSVGNLVATLTSGWTGRVHRHGRLVLAGFALYGGGICAAGLAGQLWLTLVTLGVAGAGNFVADLFRVTIWNASVPDRLRGRLAGIELLTSSVGPSVGEVRAGVVTARFGVRAALAGGGLVCVAAIGVLAVTLPSLWRYDERADPHVAAVRAAGLPQ
jgi:MFS family permease